MATESHAPVPQSKSAENGRQDGGAPKVQPSPKAGTDNTTAKAEQGAKQEAEGAVAKTKERKQRSVITATSIYRAICDIHRVVTEEQADEMDPVLGIETAEGSYTVTLFSRFVSGSSKKQAKITVGNGETIEAALADIIKEAEEWLEDYKAIRITALNAVLEQHGSVLRGARLKYKGD